MAAPRAVPVIANVSVAAPEDAVALTVRFTLRVPAPPEARGAKRMRTMQLAPAARVAPQSPPKPVTRVYSPTPLGDATVRAVKAAASVVRFVMV